MADPRPPDRARLSIPEYRPEHAEQHLANLRNVERWANNLPLPDFDYPAAPTTGQTFIWNGTHWIPSKSTLVVSTGGLALTDTNITVANTSTDWGGAVTITNPGIPVTIIGHVTGMITDFVTAGPVVSTRLGISIDNAATFTFCPYIDDAINGGGVIPNRSPQAQSWFRMNVTPTNSIVIKAQGKSTAATGTMQSGTLTYTVTAV